VGRIRQAESTVSIEMLKGSDIMFRALCIYAEISFERESTKFVYSILHTTNILIHC